MVAAMRPITHIDVDLARPLQILQCERIPFVVLVGTVVFVTVVFFGISFHGLFAAFMLMAVGVGVLRRIFASDPYFFAVYAASLRYPRSMPATPRVELPPLPFVGYGARPRISGSLRANPRAR